MRAKPLFTALVLLCVSPAPAPAQVLDVQVVTSPQHGVTAWLVEDHAAPVVSLALAFPGAGSAADPPGRAGLSTLAAATLNEGAGGMDARAFQAALEKSAIELSFAADRDALTGSLRTLSQNKEEALRLLALALTRPRFDPGAVERMRAAARAALNSYAQDPAWLTQRLLNDRAFAGHPYAQTAGGTLASLAAITPPDLRHFAGTRLTCAVQIGVAGDITPEALGPLLDETFGALPCSTLEDVSYKTTLQNTGQVFLHPSPGPQSAIAIAAPGMAPTDPDYPTWEILNEILGGAGFGSRLMEELRERRGLTYGVYTYPEHLVGVDTLRLVVSTKNASAAEVLALIRAAWRSMATKPPEPDELAAAKASLSGRTLLALTSTGAVAGTLLEIQRAGLPPDHLDRRAQALAAVTPRGVAALAERALDPAQTVTAIVGAPQGLAPGAQIVDTIPGIEK